ncbi:MAG: hypothetical protein ACRC7N_21590 [Clostridium sp.]
MRKTRKKKEKTIDKDDFGFMEEVSEEGFSDEKVQGEVIKTFSFDS